MDIGNVLVVMVVLSLPGLHVVAALTLDLSPHLPLHLLPAEGQGQQLPLPPVSLLVFLLPSGLETRLLLNPPVLLLTGIFSVLNKTVRRGGIRRTEGPWFYE